MKRVFLAFIALFTLAAHALAADNRQLVTMPDPAQAALREEMLDFTSALSQIIGSLGEGKVAEAADTAEAKLGMGAMGRHRGNPVDAMPGRFMPPDMHTLGRSLHFAATDFAKVARTGDTVKALAALQPVTATCVACHMSYRIR
jgi:hypothetical protein